MWGSKTRQLYVLLLLLLLLSSPLLLLRLLLFCSERLCLIFEASGRLEMDSRVMLLPCRHHFLSSLYSFVRPMLAQIVKQPSEDAGEAMPFVRPRRAHARGVPPVRVVLSG